MLIVLYWGLWPPSGPQSVPHNLGEDPASGHHLPGLDCAAGKLPILQAVRLTPSTTSDADNVSDEEPGNDAAYERQLLGHLLDAPKTMLP